MSDSSADLVFNSIGLAGGLLLAFSQIPEMYRLTTRRSSRDISYAYQVMFTTGMGMFMVYYWYYSLWPVFISAGCTLVFLLYMIGLKIYLEEFAPQTNEASATGVTARDCSPGSSLLPADQLAGQGTGYGGASTENECAEGPQE